GRSGAGLRRVGARGDLDRPGGAAGRGALLRRRPRPGHGVRRGGRRHVLKRPVAARASIAPAGARHAADELGDRALHRRARSLGAEAPHGAQAAPGLERRHGPCHIGKSKLGSSPCRPAFGAAGASEVSVTIELYPTPSQMQALLSGPDDEPVVMLNLLRFKPEASEPDEGATGEEAYGCYSAAMLEFIGARGARVLWTGRVVGQVIGSGAGGFTRSRWSSIRRAGRSSRSRATRTSATSACI